MTPVDWFSTTRAGAIVSDRPLSALTTFQIGGPASAYAEPCDYGELQQCLEVAADHHLAVRVLGRGSNLLISDHGVDGLVVNMRKFAPAPRVVGQTLHAGAGTPLPALAVDAARVGAWGYEFLVGIPGTVGGGVAMNAGMQGHDISEVLIAADVLDPRTGQLSRLPASDLALGYRTSRVLIEGLIVVEATFALMGGTHAPEMLRERQQQLKQSRVRRQPVGTKNCGSVFKHPAGPRAAGWYLERCDLKGRRVGDAHVSRKHANWIVNDGAATAADVVKLINLGRSLVASRFGVHLEPEVVYWGGEIDA